MRMLEKRAGIFDVARRFGVKCEAQRKRREPERRVAEQTLPRCRVGGIRERFEGGANRVNRRIVEHVLAAVPRDGDPPSA